VAIVQLCGFESGDLSEVNASAGSISVQSATKRTGAYALRVNPSASSNSQVSMTKLSAVGASGTAWATTTQYGTSGTQPASPSYGGASYGYGNIWVSTDTGEVWIYS